MKKLSALLLKMDLIKAYDRIDWVFLQLILFHVGLEGDTVSWIMACVSNVHFAILVNGAPTGFFHGQRGLRQGCPLSPLLFLIVIDGLSCLIGDAKSRCLIHGVRVSETRYLSHILFVDDVLLFGGGHWREWRVFFDIIHLFCLALGMEVSSSKSYFIAPGGVVDEEITDLFP